LLVVLLLLFVCFVVVFVYLFVYLYICQTKRRRRQHRRRRSTSLPVVVVITSNAGTMKCHQPSLPVVAKQPVTVVVGRRHTVTMVTVVCQQQSVSLSEQQSTTVGTNGKTSPKPRVEFSQQPSCPGPTGS
jgi:ABC-type Co2+ transport system permease subunit